MVCTRAARCLADRELEWRASLSAWQHACYQGQSFELTIDHDSPGAIARHFHKADRTADRLLHSPAKRSSW